LLLVVSIAKSGAQNGAAKEWSYRSCSWSYNSAKIIKTSCKMVAKMQRRNQNCYCLADCLAMRAQAHTAFEMAKVNLAQAEARYLSACHHEQLKDLEALCE
jgi:hypothetical protein